MIASQHVCSVDREHVVALPAARGDARLAVLLPAVMLLAGCGPASPTGQKPLLAAAASSLRDVAPQVADAFHRKTGARIEFSYGATRVLLRQLREGAPFDLLLAAEPLHAAVLHRDGLIDGQPVRFATGELVIWQRDSQGALELKDIRDLAAPAVRRIAIANPAHAPYGVAAMEAFNKAGIEPLLRDKLVFGEDVAQALRFAQTGDADAVLVAAPLVLNRGGRTVRVDPALHAPLPYEAVVAGRSKQREGARRFVAFLTSAEVQLILRQAGFASASSP